MPVIRADLAAGTTASYAFMLFCRLPPLELERHLDALLPRLVSKEQYDRSSTLRLLERKLPPTALFGIRDELTRCRLDCLAKGFTEEAEIARLMLVRAS